MILLWVLEETHLIQQEKWQITLQYIVQNFAPWLKMLECITFSTLRGSKQEISTHLNIIYQLAKRKYNNFA